MKSQEKARSTKDKYEFTNDPSTFTINLTVGGSDADTVDVVVTSSGANPLLITDDNQRTMWLAGAGLGRMLEECSDLVLRHGVAVYDKVFEALGRRKNKTKKKAPPTKSGKGSKRNG